MTTHSTPKTDCPNTPNTPDEVAVARLRMMTNILRTTDCKAGVMNSEATLEVFEGVLSELATRNVRIAQLEGLFPKPTQWAEKGERMMEIVFSTLSEVEALEEEAVEVFQGPLAEPSASQITLAGLRAMLEHRLSAPLAEPAQAERTDTEQFEAGKTAAYAEMVEVQTKMMPEPKSPSLWRYLQDAYAKKITFHSIGVNRLPDGGFHFYIHPQSVSGETEDYLVWPDPFSHQDLLVNKKDSPEPDVEKFRAYLKSALKSPTPPSAPHEEGKP